MARRKRRYRSRLARKESQQMVRQSVLFIILTVALVGAVIVWGIPALVKFAGFLGEIRSSSEPIVKDDNIPPFAPQIAIPFDATSSGAIGVSGFAEEEARVLLFINGSKVDEQVVGAGGEFRFESVDLQKGVNEFTAQAIDKAGNESEVSRARSVVQDDVAPELTIESPSTEGGVVSEEKVITVSGKTEPGVRVFVNGTIARGGSDGEFSARVSLDEGENTITVEAVDEAGNQSAEEFTVSYFE